MIRSSGYTLIELLVVISIVALVAVAGGINIVKFQKNALLESTAKELASTLDSARSKSISGMIAAGTDAAFYDPDYLPQFGVKIDPGQYSLISTYRIAGDAFDTAEVLETIQISPNLTLSPASSVTFTRIDGTADGTLVYTLAQTGNPQGRRITVKINEVVVEAL